MSVTRVLLAVVLASAACASSAAPKVEQRTTQGPSAEDLFVYRTVTQNGRAPTFDERRHWEGQLDLAISRYLAADQEFASSPQLSTFRLLRQPAVGMSKDQVLILLGPPEWTTTDVAEIERLARKYWGEMRGKVDEAWSYPLGWRLYFSGSRLVDITQFQSSRP